MFKAIIKVAIICALLNYTFCFKANVMFFLNSIDRSSTIIKANYNFYRLNDDPFNILDYAIFNLIVFYNPKTHPRMQHNLLITYKDQIFKKSTNRSHFERNPLTGHYYKIFEFEFDDILKIIFKCQNYSNTYVSKFLYLDYELGVNALSAMYQTNAPFMKKDYMYWIITRKNLMNYDNKINYRQFHEDCHSD